MKIKQLEWEFRVRYWIAFGLHITYTIYEYGYCMPPNSAFIRCKGIKQIFMIEYKNLIRKENEIYSRND